MLASEIYEIFRKSSCEIYEIFRNTYFEEHLKRQPLKVVLLLSSKECFSEAATRVVLYKKVPLKFWQNVFL